MATQLTHDAELDSARIRGNGTSQRGRAQNGNGKSVSSSKEYRLQNYGGDIRLTRALGWFSVGLGLAQVLAPRQVGRFVGLEDPEEHVGTIRYLCGFREIAVGAALLTRAKPAVFVANRVVGDVLDLGLLAGVMNNESNDRGKAMRATAAVLGVMALDILNTIQLTKDVDAQRASAAEHDPLNYRLPEATGGNPVLHATVTVNRPAQEVYEFFKDVQNLPRFLGHLESIRLTEGGRSHWKAKGPAGLTVEWDAQVENDVPNERITWRSVDSDEIDNRVTVSFVKAPGNRGTEVHLEVRYHPKGGAVGAKVAQLFKAIPQTQLLIELKKFKQVIETGEVVLSDATAVKGKPHPAQPSRLAQTTL